tara:strand:+ start:1418 stop:1708 length:291 start_codon:yes stop_codon:yes gene_type:complete
MVHTSPQKKSIGNSDIDAYIVVCCQVYVGGMRWCHGGVGEMLPKSIASIVVNLEGAFIPLRKKFRYKVKASDVWEDFPCTVMFGEVMQCFCGLLMV